MIAQITSALVDELQFLFDSYKITVLFKNSSKSKANDISSYLMPLVIVERRKSSDSIQQILGGVMIEAWDFAISVYDYEANQELQPDQGFSFSLMEIVNIVKNHFAQRQWFTQSFIDIVNNFSFNMTLTTGVSDAQELGTDNGLCVGFEIDYATIAYDTSTSFVQPSTQTLEYIVDGSIIPNPKNWVIIDGLWNDVGLWNDSAVWQD